MRYQERIYDQSGVYVKNRTEHVANTSSDFCIFVSPSFDLQGATKVQCNTVECVLSGFSFSNMLSAATTNCFTGSTQCYASTNWQTLIKTNGNIVYSGYFYTTSNLTGDTPTNASFYNSVGAAYTSLGYSYTRTGNIFYIDKPYGVSNLEVDVCISFNLNTNLACPAGFSANTDNTKCVQVLQTTATYNGAGTPIAHGDTYGQYGESGAYFYPTIQNNEALPFYYNNSGNLIDQTGGTLSALVINNTPAFWGNPTMITTNGRLNTVGLNAPIGEFVGFTQCIDISSTGTYYVGLAADNECKFHVNGIEYVNFSSSTVGDNYRKWSVFPINLNAGKNIIELYGKNDGSQSAFGAEIYFPSSFSTLTGATGSGLTQANVIFSTLNYVGQNWEIGTSEGYSCPTGYRRNIHMYKNYIYWSYRNMLSMFSKLHKC
jgi:hypothetical protein